MCLLSSLYLAYFFFFNDTATTEIYTLSLHDALPISNGIAKRGRMTVGLPKRVIRFSACEVDKVGKAGRDRKSTRLNSSHANISYAVFCLKKKRIKPF